MLAVSVEPQSQSQQSAGKAKPSKEIFHPGGDVSAPALTFAPDPVYPKTAHKGKGTSEGVCVLNVVVDTSGTVTDVQVIRSLGLDFDESAVQAVKQYRFTPAMRSGVAVPVAVHIEVNFMKY